MRVLLDTHAALWWLADDPRLSAPSREAIAGAEEPLFGVGTLFEVSIKASLGKFEVAEGWAEELLAEGFSLLPISLAHAHAYRELPYVKLNGRVLRDPFDRFLVAQAEAEAWRGVHQLTARRPCGKFNVGLLTESPRKPTIPNRVAASHRPSSSPPMARRTLAQGLT